MSDICLTLSDDEAIEVAEALSHQQRCRGPLCPLGKQCDAILKRLQALMRGPAPEEPAQETPGREAP